MMEVTHVFLSYQLQIKLSFFTLEWEYILRCIHATRGYYGLKFSHYFTARVFYSRL